MHSWEASSEVVRLYVAHHPTSQRKALKAAMRWVKEHDLVLLAITFEYDDEEKDEVVHAIAMEKL